MSRVLVLNPNRSVACTNVIRASLCAVGSFDVEGMADGPAAVASWADWHEAAGPLLRRVRDGAKAPAYVVACVSDPAIDLLRSVTMRPVFGALRAGIAAAVARGERFGVIAFVGASVPRHRRVLQAMGLESRCAGSVPLDLPMEALVDVEAPRARLIEVGRSLQGLGAEVLVLGCAGMAGHRRFLEEAVGLPVVEPVQAAGALALLACMD